MICVDAVGSSDACWMRLPVVAIADAFANAVLLFCIASICDCTIMLFVILIEPRDTSRVERSARVQDDWTVLSDPVPHDLGLGSACILEYRSLASDCRGVFLDR